MNFTVRVIDDDIVEMSETFYLRLSSSEELVTADDTARVTIMDNNGNWSLAYPCS